LIHPVYVRLIYLYTMYIKRLFGVEEYKILSQNGKIY